MFLVPTRRMVPMPCPRVLCETLALRLQLPARGFVLYRTVIRLEARVALLAWLLGLAVVVEAGDGLPRPVCGGLPCHGTLAGRQRESLSPLGHTGLASPSCRRAAHASRNAACGTRTNWQGVEK